MADFHDEQTVLVEMIRRMRHDFAHEIETVAPAVERERGLVAILGG
jgi:hypothetical protein